MNTKLTRILAAALAVPLALGLAACSSSGSSSSSAAVTHDFSKPASATNQVTINVGVTDGSQPHWKTLTKLAAKDHITLVVKTFTDYQQPNPAVTDGSLQVNQFQHILFLANYNAKANGSLVPVAATAVYPLGLYSKKHKSVSDFPKGGVVAIPNDATNQSRALLVLQGAGLLKLKDGGNAFSSPADIIADQSKVTVKPVNANQTAISLQDVDGSIINQNYITDAGLKASDAIYSDAKSNLSDPYINIWAATAKNKNNPNLKKLVSIYKNSKEVQNEVQKQSDGTAVFKFDKSQASLQKILDGLVSKIKAQS
ncbi:MAG: MetQ/NlpA family ABC transporter substrate-binding protein [Pseudoclavibacter sp.]